MKLGIIGSGMIAEAFLPGIMSLSGVDVSAVLCTARSVEKAKNVCAKNGLPETVVTDNFEEFCMRHVDVAYIAVPNNLHLDYCMKCLEFGIHVIVEKPMVSNYTEAVVLQNIAREKRLFVFEAITTLYLDGYKKIHEWLPKIGEVKLVQAQFSQYSSRYDRFLAGEYFPVFDAEKSGGTLMDLNVYNLHFVVGLFGEPCSTQYLARMEKGVDISGIVLMRYNSFLASCIASKDCYDSNGAVIQGTKGRICVLGKMNSIGDIMLEQSCGTVEKCSGVAESVRHLDEFKTFFDAINRNDFGFCEERMAHSVSVAKVLTDARDSAGIKFPADFA